MSIELQILRENGKDRLQWRKRLAAIRGFGDWEDVPIVETGLLCKLCLEFLTADEIKYFDGNCTKCEERNMQVMEDELSDECSACSPRPGIFIRVNSRGECEACGRRLRPSEKRSTSNPMIAEALERGEDSAGLCTVQEWTKAILESGIRAAFNENEGFVPVERVNPLGFTPLWGELSFVQDGKRYNVEMVITKIEDLPSEQEAAMQGGYDAASTEERKPGWYWVKYCGDWEPVFYDPKIVPSTPWWRNDSPVSESAFEEIGARIEEPR